MKTMKQKELDNKYLRMARIWAENSYAIKRHVGCIVVKDNMIISDGYNGTPRGFPNVCEDAFFKDGTSIVSQTKEELEYALHSNKKYDLVTKSEVLHAEANAITKLAKSNNSSKGATLYVTCEPCIECSKLIIQAEISRVVYCDEYHSHDGIKLLQNAGIEVEQIKID